MRGTRPRTPTGASNLAVSLHIQNLSPVDGSDLVVFLDLFPKVGKTTRPVIRLHSQVIATVVESVFPVSLPPPAKPGRAGPTRLGRRMERDGKDGLDDGSDHLCMWTNDRARRFAKLWKQIEGNDQVRAVYGGSVLRIERNGQVRRAGRCSRACATRGV